MEDQPMNVPNDIKIVNHGFPEDNEIGIVDQSVKYIAKTDTCGGIDMYQQMRLETVGVDFNPQENTDSFIRMKIGKTDPGEVDIEDFWSINGLEDLVKIFNDFERRRGSTVQYEVIKKVCCQDGNVITTTYK